MRIYTAVTLSLSIAAVALLAGCSTNQQSSESKVGSQDIGNAIELSYPETQILEVNAGFGKVKEITASSGGENMYFSDEANAEWLYFKASETGTLGFTIKPLEAGKNYDFVVYKKTGGDFAKEVIDKLILPLRSNLAPITDTTLYDSTGLACTAESEFEGPEGTTAYSKPLQVEKDSVYYICVNHKHASGKGYGLRLFYCGQGIDTSANTNALPPVSTHENLPPPPTLPNAEAPKPAPRPASLPKQKLSALGPDEEYYVVQPLNTVYSISNAHGMMVMELISRNRLSGNKIFVDQTLIVRKLGAAPSSAASPVQNSGSGSVPAAQPLDKPEQVAEQPSAPAKEKLAPVKEQPARQAVAETKPTPSAPITTEPTPKQLTATEPATPQPTITAAPTPASEPASKTDSDPAKPEDYMPARGVRGSALPTAAGAAPTASIEAVNAVPETIQKLWVYINVVNAKNNNPVNTIVQVVDGANGKRVDRVPSNQLTYVPVYQKDNRKKIFVLDAFSFRKESFELDLDNLKNDSSANQLALVNDTVVLNFELERYRKNDIFAAYNIFFYDDASVMLPKSKYELESLLEMLKENPKVAIRIHGHTNSSSLGKIISLEPGDKEFFRLTAKNKEGFGTATTLSKRRAESISYYLKYFGVKGPRLQIKGWGGKKMIYDRDVPLAHKNKRVEIEILED